MRTLVLALGVLMSPFSIALAADLPLVFDGLAKSAIVLPAEPTNLETRAAKELQDHLAAISGVSLEIGPTAPAGLTPIRVGAASTVAARGQLEAAHPGVDGAFALVVAADGVDLAGAGEGTLYAAYELLEQLGVRWFMPGELGTVIPKTTTVNLTTGSTIQAPAFKGRNFQLGFEEWQTRLRCGGPNFPGAHGFPGLNSPKRNKEIFAEHPEYFAEIKGVRQMRQICVSNPEVLNIVVAATKERLAAARAKGNEIDTLGMGPNDGSGFCECVNCHALDGDDYDPFSEEPSVTDRYIWFFNQVLKGIEDEFPETKIGFYIYHTYMRPPVKQVPDHRITGALAPITLCRVHGPNNPVCPEAQHYEWLANEWGKLIPGVWDRGYWSNLACPGFPFIIVHRLREQIPVAKKAGLFGWRVETFGHWGSQLPSFYIAGKLMWNDQADVDALLADFHTKFYGPAAAPMSAYTTMMDAALRDGDYHTGSSWDIPHFYPDAFRKEAQAKLTAAAALVADQPDSLYARRVTMIQQTFTMLDSFCRMMEARVTLDFAAGKAALTELDAVAETLLAYDPPMVGERMYRSYMKRFYRNATEEGYANTHDGNTLVAAAPDEWDFLTDPSGIGESLGYFRADLRGPNWQRLKTSSLSWSDQGLRYYKGIAWYRTTVEVPADQVGKRIFLWCGGVDELAKVWINGTAIGNSHGASIYPFELDATTAVKAGTNVITFAVRNTVVNELGTGGILAPVILYAPKDGDKAELHNIRDLKPTFP